MSTAARFPNGHDFALTIIDDTDNSTVESVSPVYDLLERLGLRTTKTIWVYPSRDSYFGGSIAEPAYRAWVLELQARGFEIALHNVGSGGFTRDEILAGIEEFREALGTYPKLHANHASNPDNIYFRPIDRFAFPFSTTYALLAGAKRLLRRAPPREIGTGSDPTSPRFWGDAAKQHIKYIRNLTFNDLDTLACDPAMPYRVPAKSAYSNYWFSASDGHEAPDFGKLLSPKNIDRLVRDRGAAVVYTHFSCGFVSAGKVLPVIEERLRYLSAKNGWFVPASELLDHLLAQRPEDRWPGRRHELRLSARWHIERLQKLARKGV